MRALSVMGEHSQQNADDGGFCALTGEPCHPLTQPPVPTTDPRGDVVQECKWPYLSGKDKALFASLFPVRPHYDVIMFDVDSKDPGLGMSCPPPAFVDQIFLQKVKSILASEGMKNKSL